MSSLGICRVGAIEGPETDWRPLDRAPDFGCDAVLADFGDPPVGSTRVRACTERMASRFPDLNVQEPGLHRALVAAHPKSFSKRRKWGLGDREAPPCEDLLHGGLNVWRHKIQHMRLTPDAPCAIWRIAPARKP